MLGLGRHLAVSPEGALQAPEKFGVGKLERRERRAALELRPKKTEQNRSGSVGWETTRNQGLDHSTKAHCGSGSEAVPGRGFQGSVSGWGLVSDPRQLKAATSRYLPCERPSSEGCIKNLEKEKPQGVLKWASLGPQESWRRPTQQCGRRQDWFKTKQTHLPPLLRNSGQRLAIRTQEMKGLLTLAWFLACSVPAVPGGLLELKSMIEKVTRKNAFKNYGFYGCYCGWGGRGTPKDGTDWCCQMHDRCYGQLEEKDCAIRTQSYDYRYTNGLVICEHDSFCPMRLCACDRKLVYCLRRNLWTYNPLYQYYPNFLC